jgi:hypothetical protein
LLEGFVEELERIAVRFVDSDVVAVFANDLASGGFFLMGDGFCQGIIQDTLIAS